ncbi:MAG TPA: hypothetical protein DCX54_05070 [Flavobacteriales bacterium]|nr:hypothetical protein [Flavobacteriales bacterium]
MEVLQRYGITMITSANIEWFINPNVIVIVAESRDGNEMYGGMRIHIHGGNQELPIEGAVGKIDKSIYQLVSEHAKLGTGEFCGMWNSKEVAGKGLSYVLTSAGTSVLSQLGVESMFVLCAEYTVHMVERVGFRILTNLGINGTFYYPKLNLVATALIKKYRDFSTADPEEVDLIMALRRNPNAIQHVTPYKKTEPIEVEFQLELPILYEKMIRNSA